MSGPQLHILFDNISLNKRFKAGWGFSVLVEVPGKRILFDTGPESIIPALRAFGFSPEDVDIVVVSHLHHDHYGGLEDFLTHRPGIPLYVPHPVPPDLKPLWQLLSDYHEVSEPVVLGKGIWLIGPLGSRVPETALVMQASSSVVMLVGCAHPGIPEMTEHAARVAGRPPDLIIGGLHLMGIRPHKVRQVAEKLKALGVRRVVGCHCTGKEALRHIREILGQEVTRGGAGKTIALPG